MTRVAIIGDGGWGTALALLLHRKEHQVRVWGPFPEYLEQVARTHENTKFLPGVPLPSEMVWSANRADVAAEAEVVVLAVPSRFFVDVVAAFRDVIPAQSLVVSVTKGLDQQTGERMTQVAGRILGRADIAALSGPSHAEEVARQIPTAVVVAGADAAAVRYLQGLFMDGLFRVYTSDDATGVELGGALKNIVALAVGACDGLGFGDNTKAALITRGLAEMTRLGCALGAQPATFAGLSGMGDLVVTCMSRHSRNRAVGERLGRGETIEAILASMEQVAEGVWNCRPALDLARRAGVEAPIIAQVHAVLHEGRAARAAVKALLGREARPERD